MRITNCHIHTFTQYHVPANYPHWALAPFKRYPRAIKRIAQGLDLIGQDARAERVHRLFAFTRESDVREQSAVLDNVMKHYPPDTRYVILPMEMSGFGYGAPVEPLRQQHDQLAELMHHPDYKDVAIPFATIDPRVDPEAKELWRVVDSYKFRGIKLYPRLGFSPQDERLMRHVYPQAEERGLPIMTHCSRGGVQGRFVADYKADEYTEPMAFAPVLKKHPKLQVCLAHFGGQRDWRAYANPDLDDLPPGAENWQVQIRRMIGSGEYPNLWTDISYIMFEFAEFIPFLQLLLMGDDVRNERLRQRILFGSDFYMTRNEALSEKGVCFRLRLALGEDMFARMAEENPEVWLGERAARPYPT